MSAYIATPEQRATLIERGFATRDAAPGVNHAVNTTIAMTLCGAIAVDADVWRPDRPECESCTIAMAIERLAG